MKSNKEASSRDHPMEDRLIKRLIVFTHVGTIQFVALLYFIATSRFVPFMFALLYCLISLWYIKTLSLKLSESFRILTKLIDFYYHVSKVCKRHDIFIGVEYVDELETDSR